MKRSLFSLVAVVALTGLAHAEGAVEQAPGHLIAMADVSDRVFASSVKAPTDYVANAREDLELVADDLSKKLEARLEERMTRDLRVALQ